MTADRPLPRRCRAAALALLLGGLWPAAQAATALGAGIDLRAVVKLGGSGSTATDSQDWAAPDLSPLSAATAVDLQDAQGNTVRGELTAIAKWNSANRGRVEMQGFGWTFDVQDTPASVILRDGNRDWRYAFLAGAKDTLFTMDYIVAGFGDTFGLEGWAIELNGGPEGLRQQGTGGGLFDPSVLGSFSGGLTPGQAYVASLRNGADFAVSNAERTGEMWGTFDWKITTAAVPEPSTYALMAVGLAVLGASARKRARD